MNDRRKDFIGDLIMTTTIGCATVAAFMMLCGAMWVILMILSNFLNNPNN